MIARLLRVDPWGPLLTLVSLGVFLVRGLDGGLDRDVALYAYAGQRFAEGDPPYVGVMNRSGPLAHAVPGLGVLVGRVLDLEDLVAMRLLMMLVSAACVWAVYLLARDCFGSRAAGVLGVSTLLTFQGFLYYASYGPREKTTMILFLALALWALTGRRWATAGVMTALATLTWQGAFLPLAAATVLACSLAPGRRATVAALTRYAAGGSVVTAATVGYFLLVGALQEFLAGFVLVNAGYTTQRGLLTTLGRNPDVLGGGYAWSWILLVGGVMASLGLAAARLRRLDVASGPQVAVVAIGLAIAVELVWTLAAFQSWPDSLVFTPLAAAGVAGLGQGLATRLPAAWGRRALVGTATLLLVAAAVTSHQMRNTQLRDQRAEVAAVLAAVGPGSTMLSVGAPQALVITGARNPLQHQMFRGGIEWYVDDTYPGGLAQLARDIESWGPTLVMLDDPRRYPWLKAVLRHSYIDLGGSDEIRWYLTETAERDVVRATRSILREGPPGAAPSAVQRSWS